MRTTIAPGARVVIRDADWLVRRVDSTSTGGRALSVVGISEIVRDREAIFLDEIEPSIEVLDPAETRLVADESPNYRASLLYMEALLRQAPPTDDRLYVGNRAAMDPVPYQFDPALQALEQPRQRILIADAVGLGKTLEAGVLVSELIKRGKGKRVLVVTLKSMLTQFQKEFWSRFTIPLVRLDSRGIQRIRRELPTNHNPFYYYDRTIISIDTLKQDAEYRAYIENAYWDIIVIDEAQNVADRGTRSLRTRLAHLLSERSDTLIMLSATPHDGKAQSFASLMNMLDPTAIADPKNYGPEDIKGLFIRRFKKDIQDQVEGAFRERTIELVRADSSDVEERVYDALAGLNLSRLDDRRGGATLFTTTLTKSLLSSPAACASTIRNRIARLERGERTEEYAADISALTDLLAALEKVTPKEFSKYRNLVSLLRGDTPDFDWNSSNPADRIVVFTERIETLHFLRENLLKDLKLKPEQIAILYGGLSDVEQQEIVEDFGREDAPVRILLASDVASEGINLHYLCHRLIHFDIPWSLMVFQQRNGRIDRYGQEETPQILYLVTESRNRQIHDDTRILEILIEKDQQATENIGDPRALMGLYDIDEEEKRTARAIEGEESVEEFEKSLEPKDLEFDPLQLLMGEEGPPTGDRAGEMTASMPSLFQNNYDYAEAALQHLRGRIDNLQVEFYPAEERIDLTAPNDLEDRFDYLPPEIYPSQGHFVLSGRAAEIQNEIRRCRESDEAWPRLHYLWEFHPILTWINDKVLASFGRHEAPVLTTPEILEPGETIFILSGVIPNRKSHPLIQHFFGVRFHDGEFRQIETLSALLERTDLHRKRFPNPKRSIDADRLQGLLQTAIERGEEWMLERREEFEKEISPKLARERDELKRLRARRLELLAEETGAAGPGTDAAGVRHQEKQREIESIFRRYTEWVHDTMKTETSPYIQVVAVLATS